MSLVRTEVTLKNAGDLVRVKDGNVKETEVRQITVKALVDTGAFMLVINEETCEKLGLYKTGTQPGTLADGKEYIYDTVGPLEVWWKNRRCPCDALLLPDADEILLGAFTLEVLDLTINPNRELVGIHGDEMLYRV